MDSIKIDWSKPIEAVHTDGRVEAARAGDLALSNRCWVSWRGNATTANGDGKLDPQWSDWTIRNVAPKEVEWGPAIEVFKEKPWFIKPDTVFEYKTLTCVGDCWHSWLAPDWESVVAVRLKVNHPYYDNTQTHTYTVASEDEAALNASRPTPTRTALEQRMEDLVRKMATWLGESDRSQCIESARWQVEARAILAELEPVDGDLLEAREIMADLYPDTAGKIRNGDWDKNAVRDCLQGLRRGRALERGE